MITVSERNSLRQTEAFRHLKGLPTMTTSWWFQPIWKFIAPPKSNIEPENQWLENEIPFGMAYFQGLRMATLVSGSVVKLDHLPNARVKIKDWNHHNETTTTSQWLLHHTTAPASHSQRCHWNFHPLAAVFFSIRSQKILKKIMLQKSSKESPSSVPWSNPYYWVDDHPLLYGNNGSLDPGTSAFCG